MKVAICISGHLRGGNELCYPSLKKYLLDKYDCDIFVSAFREMGNVQFVHLDTHPIEAGVDVSNIILDTYKPVRHTFNSANDQWIVDLKNRWKDLSTRNTAKLFQIVAMHRNIYEANHLKKMYEADSGVKYDIVVRTRFDNELLSDVIEDSKYVDGEHDLIFKSGYQGVFDQTFWGGNDVMEAASEAYLYISQIVGESNAKSFENAENVFTAYLDARRIPFITKNEIKISITKPHGRHVT